MLVLVLQPFVGLGFNMPAPGSLLDVHEDIARQLLDLHVVARYETKIDPLPPELKAEKKTP